MFVLEEFFQICGSFLLVFEHLVSSSSSIFVFFAPLLANHNLINFPLFPNIVIDPSILRTDHIPHFCQLLFMFDPSLHIELMIILNLHRSSHLVLLFCGAFSTGEITDMIFEALHSGFIEVLVLSTGLLFTQDVQAMSCLVDFVLDFF